MQKIHYVGVSVPLWVSFKQSPEMILDWLLHVHEQREGSYSRLTIDDAGALLELIQDVDVEFADGTSYRLIDVLLGEGLIVNEDDAVVVGVVDPMSVSLVRGILAGLQKEEITEMSSGPAESMWSQWVALREFYETTFRNEEIILIYYE